MREFAASLLNGVTLVFAVASMLSVGLAYSAGDILAPLRDVRAVVRALTANFLLVPLLALLLIRLFPMEPALGNGLLLMAFSAGAPFLIKLTMAARGELALSAALLVLLVPVTVVYMPVALPAVLSDADITVSSIAKPLFLSMLLPLALGLAVRSRVPSWAARFQPLMGKTSSLMLAMVVGITLLLHMRSILAEFREGAVFVALVFTGGTFAIGYGLASARAGARTVLGLGTAQRNVAAAMVAATQSFSHPRTLDMVIIVSLVSLTMLFPIAKWLRMRDEDARRTFQPAA